MENIDAFNNLQDDYDQSRPTYPNEAIKKLADYFTDNPCPSILDVGCGTGIFTRQLADLFKNSQVFGSDINATMIEKAQQSSKLKHPHIDYGFSEAEQLPYSDQQLNMLCVAQAIQWFDRPAFYKEVTRLLKADGILALIENNRAWQNSDFLDDYETLLERYSPNYSRHYRSNDYVTELDEHGFSKVEVSEHLWQRSMHKDAFIQMTKSSTKMQSALLAHGNVAQQSLISLIEKHIDAQSILNIDYITKVIIARV